MQLVKSLPLAFFLALGTSAASGGDQPYFPPPESQGGWRKPQSADEIGRLGGMDPHKLTELKQWLLDSDKRDFAAVVIRHGYIVLEVERGNSAKTDTRRVASVSKAICATVLAIASEQSQRGLTPKKMKFDDPAFQFIPWAQPLSDPRKGKITVEQLLNHTSGICPEATGAPNDGSWEYILGHGGDKRTATLAFDPGTACGYSTHALAHAAVVCETVTGMPYDQFAIQALFKPIGVEHWSFQSYDGAEKYGRHPSHGMGMPARDLARIAYCMLRGGRWNDQQVIPKWFVDETATPTHNVKTPEMRWKLNPQIFSHGWELPARLSGEGGRSGSGIPADARAKPGSGGQYIAFVPSLDLVITRQTGSSGDWPFEEYLRRACATVERSTATAGETLYNGIVLPREWPPRLAEFPTSVERNPVTPPYLLSPPDVIPIDVGRQLFVDDFLIAKTTLTRTYHLPKYHPASPVLKPDQPWELKNPDHAAAMVFSDGVWYDPKDQLFKMWYLGGESASTGYATSTDGIHWNKPLLDIRPPTNIVQPGGRDSSTVWLDLEEKDSARRFKMFRVIGAGEDPVTGWNNWVMAIHFSSDGIHWGEPVAKSGRVVDRSTVFWNPFRKVWVYSIRHVYKSGDAIDKRYGFARKRSYVEGSDLLAAARWDVNEPLRWTDIDRLDPQRDDLKIKPQLYNLDAVAYESLMVGFFTVWRGQPADRHKPNNVMLGYSRDGWHWSRPDRRAFCPVSDKQGDWNANNVQSAGGGFLVVGDELYFYVSGRSGRPGNNKAGTCTTGLATLRRDGFASMDAGETEGTLTTRAVRFAGKHLFVNVDAPGGELRVEVLNQAGDALPQFTSIPVTADKTLQPVRWKGADDLSSLANQPVRFRFRLKNGKLYSFWVSPQSSGASHGYVAAGGPGFSSNRDN